MALKGNLRDFSTTQLLNLIHLARKTGTLTIHSQDVAQVAFREGKLIAANVGDAEASSLATVLQQAGKLSTEQASYINERANNTGEKQLGHLLIQAGVVTQSDIIQSVRKHVLDTMFKLFTWADGMFRFDGNMQPSSERITIPIDLESVIMEGSRRLKEWERLSGEIPDLDVALQFADRPDARLRTVNLTVQEWRVVSFINPRNTIRQIAAANNLTEFEIRRIVYGMLQAGLVDYVTAPQADSREVGTRQAKRQRRDGQQELQQVQIEPAVKRSVVQRLIRRIRNL